ncbi:glutamate receptor-interacting protein 2-like isoform X2 [Clavelina lepadiformis]|uniref:glutamate receptor-interacting protein 2-like isoform X2 n=1 Tax=Clavelina lepadiformis TaxID=159417 RepID=UPI00404299C7
MGSSHSSKQGSVKNKEEDPLPEGRNLTLPRKGSGLRHRLSNLKTGSLKRAHTLQANELSAAELAILSGKKWHSDCSLTNEKGSKNKGRGHAPVTEEELQVVPARVEEIPEEERGSCIVNLTKKDGSVMGLTLTGGVDKEGRPRVSNLRSTGIAAKSDKLQVGDYITAVNGIRTSKLKHGEIISLLKNIGERVSLEIEYHLPPTTVQTSTIVQKTTEIFLKKNEGSFGFVLRGGGHEQHCKSRPLVVTHIRPDSPAAKEGSLKTGDRIVSIGTTQLKSLCLEEAINNLENCGDEAVFTIEYDVSVVEAVANASGPLLVEVSNTPGTDLGITLAKSTYRKRPVLVIDRVRPASISDRCGALHIGDQILSIDNVSVANGAVTLREASEMLSSSSDFVKLEILPVSHLAIASAKSFSQNRFAPVITNAQSMSALNSQRIGGSRFQASTLSGRSSSRTGRKRMQRPKYSASATTSAETEPEMGGLTADVFRTLQTDAGFMSLVSTDYLSGNQVVHTEVLEIQLLTADDGCDLVTSAAVLPNFGIQLQGSVFATEILHGNPTIGFIEPDRAADRCGLVQAGDRITSVNGYSCEEYSADEVNQLLNDAYYSGQVVLQIEFDVAESVVPSSGTFHQKLPKRRGVDLGIVVSAPSGRYHGHALMISEVKRGSVAHRTGTLEAGDRLLAIDGVRLDECTPDDAHALLASAEDVVRLKIQKDEENSDDADSSNVISYTVELKRRGGPLGITISGTEEPFDPIFISGLAPGGLADRTGAIHEGDKIQSINGISLRAKKLSEAIGLLQNAGELVTLKIKRNLPSPADIKPMLATSRHSPFQINPSGKSPILKNDTISEFSDPEDDILPPRMGPLSDHSPFSDPTSSPKQSTPTGLPPVFTKDRGVRPGPAGAPSVDSAVESWEDSSAELYGTRSSAELDSSTSFELFPKTLTGYCPLPLSKVQQDLEDFLSGGSAHPSAVSSIPHEATSPAHQPQYTTSSATVGRRAIQPSTLSRLQRRSEAGTKIVDHLKTRFEPNTSRTYSDTWGTREQIRARNFKSPEISSGRGAPVADWQRALEDLQSVGQSTGFLRDLETNLTLDTEDRNRQTGTFRRQPPSDDYTYRHLAPGGGVYDTFAGRRDMPRQQQTPSSLPLQLHRLSLCKDSPAEDFGFSVSDGQLERGVYVHTVRPGSAAARAGLLPYDRLLQVNGTSTYDVDCSMAIPLITCAQSKMDVLVSRNPSNASAVVTHHQGRPVLSPPVSLTFHQREQHPDPFPTL